MTKAILLTLSADAAKMILVYGVCAGIILIALIIMGCMKRHTKKQLRATSVKKACLKAKSYAEETVAKHTKADKLLGATKLHKLSNLVADAAWLAYQIVEVKRDILFDGIADGLDALATSLSLEAEQGYLPDKEYEETVQSAIATLDATVAKLDDIIKAK